MMRVVHARETDDRGLKLPLRRCDLDPMSSDRKVRVSVTGLPRVASQRNFAFGSGSLEIIII